VLNYMIYFFFFLYCLKLWQRGALLLFCFCYVSELNEFVGCLNQFSSKCYDAFRSQSLSLFWDSICVYFYITIIIVRSPSVEGIALLGN
jgi:hypothetical protein